MDNQLVALQTTLITSVISIISIFLSNWLGRSTDKKKYELQTIEKTYLNYYVPLMKHLSAVNRNSLTFFWIVASWYLGPEQSQKNAQILSNLLYNNLELLPPSIVNKISPFSVAVDGAKMFFAPDGYRENYRQNLITASKLFDEIIIDSLKEASKISKKLGYPDIAKPILESFLELEQNQHTHPRYLPEIYQKDMPRVFQGSEPPYY